MDGTTLCLLVLNSEATIIHLQLCSAGSGNRHTVDPGITPEGGVSSRWIQGVKGGLSQSFKKGNKGECSIYKFHPVVRYWILCGVITGPKKRKVTIWAGFRNYRLAVIKLPRMTSELRGFKLVCQCVGQGGQGEVPSRSTEAVKPALLNSCLTLPGNPAAWCRRINAAQLKEIDRGFWASDDDEAHVWINELEAVNLRFSQKELKHKNQKNVFYTFGIVQVNLSTSEFLEAICSCFLC